VGPFAGLTADLANPQALPEGELLNILLRSLPLRHPICFITRAGTPATIVPSGTSSVTTELAPTTHRLPIVTPLVTTQLTPNQQLEPIRTGPLLVKPCQVTGVSGS